MFDLFSANSAALSPLAERFRPETLDEFLGQKHIVGEGTLLRRAIKSNTLGSCIFYGPPGTGKSTLAHIIAATMQGTFEKLNAVSAGVADCKRVISEADERLRMYGKRTYLLLDECHRFNKAQSDSLLGAIEKGQIIFIGSTTENPYVSMTPAIVSRCRVFKFVELGPDDIKSAMYKACKDSKKGLGNLNVILEPDACEHIVRFSSGDLRNALNALELAALSTPPSADGKVNITLQVAEASIQSKAVSVDNSLYYDLISAFCKSLRGSDSDAALYYSQRLIAAGCDPMLIARRLMVHASEDVGMADPNAMVVASSAVYALEKLGLPEGAIPLSNAIIYVCEAEKSNSVVSAMGAAAYDAQHNSDDNIPHYLRDTSYMDAQDKKKAKSYKYPHDYGGYVEQQYLPDSLIDRRYYNPGNNGYEKKGRKKDK